MAASGYVADSFVAGEQPTTAKWNELWGNDASFNNGNGFNDGIIVDRHVASAGLNSSKLYNPYKFSAYSTGGTLNAATWTKIPFQTKEYDTGSNYDNTTNYRFTAPVAGFYRFSAGVEITGNAGDDYAIAIYKNGAEAKRGIRMRSGSSGTFQMNYTVAPPPIQLAAGDYIEVWGYNGTGGSKGISSGQILSYFGGEIVSAS